MAATDVHIGHTNIEEHKGLNGAQHCGLKITVPDYVKQVPDDVFWMVDLPVA